MSEEQKIDRIEAELTDVEKQWDPELRDAIRLGREVREWLKSETGKHVYNRAMEELRMANITWLESADPGDTESRQAHLKAKAIDYLLDWLNEALQNSESAEAQLESEHEHYEIEEEGGLPSEV